MTAPPSPTGGSTTAQYGNNNAYCHDSGISWLDWDGLEKNRPLFACVRELIALRKAHPVLRCPTYDRDYNGTGYPELSFHGLIPWQLDEHAPALSFAYLYAEDRIKYGTERDCFIYVIVNAHWEAHSFQLPVIPRDMRWRVILDSERGVEPAVPISEDGWIHIGPRASAVLAGE